MTLHKSRKHILFIICVSVLVVVYETGLPLPPPPSPPLRVSDPFPVELSTETIREVFVDHGYDVTRPDTMKPYTVLVFGAHSGPKDDLTHLLPQMGVKMLYHKPPRSFFTSFRLDRFEERRKYAHNYVLQHAMKADMFICYFDSYYCALLLQFNRPILIMSAYRFDGHLRGQTRQDSEFQHKLFLEMMRHPRVMFSCTNYYDCLHTHHFLGTRRILPLPAVATYIRSKALRDILLGSPKCRDDEVSADLMASAKSFDFASVDAKFPAGYVPYPKPPKSQTIATLPQGNGHAYVGKALAAAGIPEQPFKNFAGGRYDYCQLTTARASVFVPYAPHTYGTLEANAIGLPVFVPSPRLLASWHVASFVMHDHTSHQGKPQEHGFMPVHPRALTDLDPDSDTIPEALEFWFQFTDYAVAKGPKTFDSEAELVEMLRNITDDELALMARTQQQDTVDREALFKRNMAAIFAILLRDEPPLATLPNQSPGPPYGSAAYKSALQKWHDDAAGPDWAAPQDVPTPEGPANWIVVHSNSHPSSHTLEQAAAENWQLLVVGDGSPQAPSWLAPGHIHLTHAQLDAFDMRILRAMPHDHAFRATNAAYLYAIRHGAQTIHDRLSPGSPTPLTGALVDLTAHNVAFGHDALWALLLPVSVSSDLAVAWRGYRAQRLLWDLGIGAPYPTSDARDVEVPPEHLPLVRFLKSWRSAAADRFHTRDPVLFDSISLLSLEMASQGLSGMSDYDLTVAWLLDLLDAGYKPPPLQ